MKYLKHLLILLGLFIITNSHARTSELFDQLFNENKYHQVTLSPDGQHLGLVKQGDEQRELVIVNTQTMKAINHIYFDTSDEVSYFTWANNERVIISLSSKVRNREYRGNHGELYAIDIDKSEGKFIFGPRSIFKRGRLKGTSGFNKTKTNLYYGHVLNSLPQEDDHILIQTYNSSDADDAWIYKLNIYSGKLKTIVQLKNKIDNFDYTSENNELWHSYWSRKDSEFVLKRFDFVENKWQEFKLSNQSFDYHLIFYSDALSGMILKGYCGNNTIGLCLFNPQKKSLTSIFHHPTHDLDQFFIDEGKVVAAQVHSDYPIWDFYQKDHEFSQLAAALQTHFKGAKLTFSRFTKERQEMLVGVESDIDPKSWYLFDPGKEKLKFVANRRAGKFQGQPVYSFNFTAADGLGIQGYLTLPEAAQAQSLPAILLVHGGPFGVRDEWTFNSESQFLATLGYAVIQINYRGSLGNGKSFLTAGYQQWGGDIQQDLLAGLDYLSQQKIIDNQRLCVMGGSFGAYSAIRLNVMTPERFRCAIATAGLYNLQEYFDRLDSSDLEAWFELTMGNEETRVAHSVVKYAKKIKAPILLAHGTKDRVTEYAQLEEFVEALVESKKTYEAITLPKESHYFYNPKNRKRYYQSVAKFLDKHNPID